MPRSRPCDRPHLRLLRHPDRLGGGSDRGPAPLAGQARGHAPRRRGHPGLPGIDAELCEPAYRPYRAVLAGVVEGFGRRFGFPVGVAERDLLAWSLPTWKPFPDTVGVLRALKGRYRLAVVSNIDDDLFAATAQRLGVDFDHVVTAEQVGSYKPSPPIFEEAIRRLGVAPDTIAHVAEGASEVPPARRLGCATVWVRRHGRSARLLTEAPDLEVPDLRSLLAWMGIDG